MGLLPDTFAYLPRVVDGQIAERLRIMPMVVVDGPRACGKTTTASRLARREVLLDQDHNAREHADHGTLPLADGPFPTLLDEWQLAAPLWNQLRRISDRIGRPGLFLLRSRRWPLASSLARGRAFRLDLQSDFTMVTVWWLPSSAVTAIV